MNECGRLIYEVEPVWVCFLFSQYHMCGDMMDSWLVPLDQVVLAA